MLVTEALRDRASDVHLEPTDGELRVRFRIDGALHDVLSLPITMAGALVSRVKILADMNIVERRKAQDGQFATEVDGRGIDVRVSTMATVFGEKCVMRILDKSRSLHKLGQLGMPRDTQNLYHRMVRSPFGMVLCAGPTGSGKTTTLYATLNEIDERSATSSPSRTRSSTSFPRSTRSRPTRWPGSLSPKACGPSCARTPT